MSALKLYSWELCINMPLALATKHLAPQHCKNTKHALHGKLYMYDLEDSSTLLGASHAGVYVA